MLVDTNCGRLFVEVTGEGPDVVLWHSLLCDGGMWRAQAEALRERCRVINIDGPGHGRSAPTRTPYTMDDCVRAALTVLDEVGAERPIWCGLSWGGMVGMRLAARHPERVRALVLMDTSAQAEDRKKIPSYKVMATISRTIGPPRFLAGRIVPIMFGRPDAHPDAVERFVDHLLHMDPASLGHAVDAVIFERDDVSGELGRIDVPTLVMVGDRDTATPPSKSEHLANLIPHARLVRIPDAGHLATLEEPARVNEHLLPFVAEHAG